MIRDVGESLGNTVLETVGRAVGRAQERRPLPADLLESDDAFLAVFDAPGIESTDVQVRFENSAILVRVDRFREFHEGFEMQFPGRGLSLDGRVRLPEDASVDPETATATLKDDGTLHVRLPKRSESDDAHSEQTEAESDAAGASGVGDAEEETESSQN